MTTATWEDFERIDMRVGRVTAVEEFPEARQPAWKLEIDFGPELGTRRSLVPHERKRVEGIGADHPLPAGGARGAPGGVRRQLRAQADRRLQVGGSW